MGDGGPVATEGAEPPLFVQDGGIQWVRTEIARGADLVNGEAWITEFDRRLRLAMQALKDAVPKPAGGRRLLRQVASDGDNPQFWSSPKDAPLAVRNEVLRDMAKEASDPNGKHRMAPGRMVRLATGQDVIFWFNVGPPGKPADRVYVTEAYCPHQQLCLNFGELKDIEDLSGGRRGMIRCPRHNKAYDLASGESPGNEEKLRRYPARFEHGRWYVGIGPIAGTGSPSPALDATVATCAAAAGSVEGTCEVVGDSTPAGDDVEMGGEVPVVKRPRILLQHMTVG